MYKTTVEVHGMMCGMCEAHINDVVRKTYPQAKKVASSRTKKETTFVTDEEVDTELLRAAINATGYEFISAHTEDCGSASHGAGIFSFLHRDKK